MHPFKLEHERELTWKEVFGLGACCRSSDGDDEDGYQGEHCRRSTRLEIVLTEN